MPKNTVHVEELEAKIKFLATDKIAMHLGKHNSEKTLLDRIRPNARTTVRSGYTSCMINVDIEGAIAQACQFDCQDWSWRGGSKGEFAKAYYERHHELANGSAVGIVAVRRAPLVILEEDISADTRSTHSRFAWLALRSGPSQSAPGEVMLGFDLNCPDDKSDGLITGLRRCILHFDCGSGRTTEFAARTGYPAGATFDGVTFTPLSVDARAPSWVVEAQGDRVIGMVGSVPATFLRVKNLTPGDSIRATLRAYLKEIATTFVVAEQKGRSVGRLKIQKRLQELDLKQAENGETELASTEMRFVGKVG